MIRLKRQIDGRFGIVAHSVEQILGQIAITEQHEPAAKFLAQQVDAVGSPADAGPQRNRVCAGSRIAHFLSEYGLGRSGR